MQPFALSLLALTLAACGRAPTSVPTESAAKPSAAPIVAEKLKAEVRALPEPNRYEVELTWEAADRGVRWWITRESSVSGKTFPALAAEARAFTDDTPLAGQTFDYTLTTETPVEPPVRLSVRVVVPLDREIVGAEEVDEIRAHRLFLRAKADVRPRGNILKIVADSLFAEPGAVLRALPEKAESPQGFDGRSGPPIYVKARFGSGALLIRTDGGRGGSGEAGGMGAAGAAGMRGLSSDTYTHEGRDTARTICEREAGNGGRGADGATGLPGGVGKKGGDTAPVFLRIGSAANLVVKVEGKPGMGGPGGAGGQGGPGGSGGPPGINSGPCRAQAQPGSYGARGNWGPLGKEGPVGNESYSCLHLGESTYGTCPPPPFEPLWNP